jgi:hypothetical protein
MKIVLCQYWTSNISYKEFTYKINKEYCDLKNYIYHVEDDDETIKNGIIDRAITWYKPKFIKQVFELYNPDYILFLDADAVVCNYDYNIEEFIDEKYNIVCTEDYGPSKINAGVFLMKNTEWTKNFLQEWWDSGETLRGVHNNEIGFYKNALWHDQTCFSHLLNDININTEIKIISNNVLNGREFTKNNFIFHAFSYGYVKNRTIDSVYYKMFNIEYITNDDTKLSDIVDMYPIDKNHEHDYYKRIYDKLFENKKNIKNIVEFSSHPFYNSFEVLKKYFKEAEITGIFSSVSDEIMSDDRIKKYISNQSDREKMTEISNELNEIDVIFDDGSHKMFDQQLSLYLFIKSLKEDGIYIMEDLHTSIECKIEGKQVFGWGDIDKKTTLETLREFINTGIYDSDYLTKDECKYLTENIKDCKIYDERGDWSIVAIITKKTKEKIDLENYELNKDGLLYQVSKKTFLYDIDYVKNRYDKYGELSNYISNLRLGYILGVVDITIKSIMDIGYGNGSFLKTCKKIIPNCYGYDIHKYELSDDIVFVEDWINQEVDVVTFFDVIEHFDDPYIIKNLKTNYIIISVPWCHNFRKDWFMEWKHRRPDEHLWFFNEKNIFDFAKSINYEIINYKCLEDVVRGPLNEKNNILTFTLKKNNI